MTAVRLRGNDANQRALDAYRLNTHEFYTVKEIADQYDATERAVYTWIKQGRKLALPDLDDKTAWFKLLVQDQGSRLEDAKDADSVALSKNLQQLLGVGSAEELKQHMARLETAKVALIAQAFDQATSALPNRKQLRAEFLQALETHESG